MSALARTVVVVTLPLYPLIVVLLALLNIVPGVPAPGRFNYFGWAVAHGLGLLALLLMLILLRNPTADESDFVLPRETAISVAYLIGLIVAAIMMWIFIRKHWAQRQGDH